MKCIKKIQKNPKGAKTKNRRIMFLSKCTVRDSKKLKFIKEQDASRFLSSLGIKTLLCKIPLIKPFFVLEVLTS